MWNSCLRRPRRGFDLSPALEKITHRGPDDNASSLSLKHDDRNYINLGHVRLSIMDLDPRSNQPYFKHANYVLVFNGEIYNFKDLRRELEKALISKQPVIQKYCMSC